MIVTATNPGDINEIISSNPLKPKLDEVIFKDSGVHQREHNTSQLQRSTG
jgi:hypothetical protein